MNKLPLILILILASCKLASDYQTAQKSAEDFIKYIPSARGVSCTQADTDNDGYCTCTVFRTDQEPISIQCGCEPATEGSCQKINPARGCKMTQPKMNVQVRQ